MNILKQSLLIISFALSGALLADDCLDHVNAFLRPKSHKVLIEKTKNMNVTKYGFVDNASGREGFEKLYLQCMTANKPSVSDPMSKRLTFMQHKLSYATTVVGFTAANWDKPKDMQWFGRLAFGIAFGEALGKIAGKLIVDKGNRFHYLIKDYLFTRSAVATYLSTAPLIFDMERSQRKKMNEMKLSKTFQEDMQKLKVYVNREGFYERYKVEVMNYLSHLEVINTGLGIHQGIDFDKLTPQDLEDEDIQEVVMAAIIAQEYENQKGLLNITQNNSLDFFLFDALYSIIKIPKDIAVGKVVNQVMCLNRGNPTRGLTQAIGISTLNQIMFADFYGVTYRVAKKEFINQ